MSSKVYFGSVQHGVAKPSASFAVKVDKVVDMLDLSTIEENDKVVIKMHLGFNDGYQTIPVFFIRRIVNKIKKYSMNVFITDNPTSVFNAADRGYTSETVGCPIVPITGIKDGYKVKKEVNYRNVPEIYMAGVLQDADVLFDISHIKGHNSCGFGGQIKNLGLGGFAQKSRWEKIHGVPQSLPYWDKEKCTPEHAEKLKESCPYNAIKYNKEKHRLRVIFDECNNTNCWECRKLDEESGVNCLSFGQEHFSAFSELQAIAAKEVIDTFDFKKRFFIAFALEITAYCDCWGFAQPVVVNDIGVLSSRDVIAIETATLDLIGKEGLMEKNVPPFFKHLNITDSDLHPFQRIHGKMKDPYMAVNFLHEMSKDQYSKEYELIEVLSPEETSKEAPEGISEKAPSFF
jgi:uncharacterized Fe-S center protein